MDLDFLVNAGAQLIAAGTAAFAIAAIGLNLHFGFTGLLNIGQAGFMLIGAYGFAITVKYTNSFWLGLVVAIVAAVIFALILGLPTLTLRGDYLAIVTIAAAEIVRIVGGAQALEPVTGAVAGIPGSRFQGPFVALSPFAHEGKLQIGPYNYPLSAGNSWWLILVAWVLVIVIALIVWLLVRSPWGRVVRGIREDEFAVRSLGKNVYSYKLQALVIGGVIGALGGVIYALATSVQPDALGRTTTFVLFTCLLLGGAATVWGPVLGTILYFVLRSLLTSLIALLPPNLVSQQQGSQLVWILVGVGLMLLVIFRPQGILGNKKELSFGD